MDRRLRDLPDGLSGLGASGDRRRQFVDPRNRCRDRRRLLPTPTKYDDDGCRDGRYQRESPCDGEHLLLLHVHSVPVRCGRMPLLTPTGAEVVVWRA